VTKLEEDHWQSVPSAAPPGWYPDPPMLRYWTGESWTAEVRPAGPPSSARRIEDVEQWGEASGSPWHPPTELRALGHAPVRRGPRSDVPEDVVCEAAVGRDSGEPWPVGEAGLEEPAPSEGVEQPHLVRELAKFALVALLAVAAGALVAVVGIALTV
jgi:hypothetical protein